MISFIVPAYNEANQIAEVIHAIRVSAEAIGADHEIIAVNDASEDETAALARDAGATVLDVRKRQIAAVRNAGAARARGDLLVFVDADTFLDAGTLAAALREIDGGAVGGGALFRFDHAPWTVGVPLAITVRMLRMLGLCGGCFVFVRRDAFEDAGGFDETLFATEEVALARTLRRSGRFVVLGNQVVTSGRKARRYSVLQLIGTCLRIGVQGPKALRRREGLEIWYDGWRESGTITNGDEAQTPGAR